MCFGSDIGAETNKHRRCVEVAAITCYQSLRRQQRVPGVVTLTYRVDDPSTCLRRLKNLNFKLAFAIDIIIRVVYEQSVRPF